MVRKQKNDRGKNGFSLIEIVLVISILSILAAIALPWFLSDRAKALNSAALSDVTELRTQLEAYYAEWDKYPN